jgi:hypothetical protein
MSDQEPQQTENDEDVDEFVEEVESDPSTATADDEDAERVRGG